MKITASIRKGPTLVISVSIHSFLRVGCLVVSIASAWCRPCAWKDQDLACYPLPLVVTCVPLSLLCLCVWDWPLCTATENLWLTCDRMINLIPELPLAQCWKNVKQEFSGNLEHLQLSQKWRIWFYMENHGEDLGFSILAVCSCLVKFLWKFSFIIQLWYIKLVFSREWEDVNKTLRLGISWVMVVNGPVWMLSSAWSRMLIRWSWCFCEIFDSSSWHQDTVLLFGRALSGQVF